MACFLESMRVYLYEISQANEQYKQEIAQMASRIAALTSELDAERHATHKKSDKAMEERGNKFRELEKSSEQIPPVPQLPTMSRWLMQGCQVGMYIPKGKVGSTREQEAKEARPTELLTTPETAMTSMEQLVDEAPKRAKRQLQQAKKRRHDQI
ncbi:hypothetical protein GQ44DRAFT_719950 [Phaeosphaeriaceae sp. PMI808]|nr:hypothetical protein GQ44DRAFT_719950 [Phaeosphaeriaceae sp. PMI808]